MTTFCVLNKDVDQGDDFVHGPFTTRQEAVVFAANLIDRYRDEADEPLFIDADTNGAYVCLQTEDDTTIREAIVQELVTP